MRCSLGIATAVALVLLTVSPVRANLITNGDFETVGGDNTFTGWSDWPVTTNLCPFGVQTASLFTGGQAHSAEVVKGTNSADKTKDGAQNYTTDVSDVVFSLDFAVLTTSGKTARLSLAFANQSGYSAIDMDTSNTAFRVLNGNTWGAVSGLAIVGTSDVSTYGIWNGEAPTKNHLVVTTHFDQAVPSYDIELNGVTVEGLTAFGGVAPTNVADGLSGYVMLSGAGVARNWLVDNVSVTPIPEPSVLSLLTTGLIGLLAYAWRKRK